ncbi:hypothetical protein [Bacillus glycinifermentans]|uniref:hypothetical protein n=1 Tax=Bacillus glycinifermentans TaxID=1664069 RepID=UPI001FF68BEF|nr:hypothetical protein [Bacillus glycinifermentans]UOY86848.1 hypothetical protein MW696_12055 [Bacillus glycinifermentans]
MAKLEGVKTLDMVNGEITKVSYDGAEYERVEGPAQTGDLVLPITDGFRDATKGSFYKAIDVDRDGDAVILDDVGDRDGSFRHNYDLFRKVSASHPSLEDRVSTNEKDIEFLKFDVSTLKGEAEPKYIRIDKSEAKAGDFVKFDEAPNRYLTAGKYYEICRVDDYGDPHIVANDGDRFDTYYAGVFEVYRKVSAAEPKPERLKVGDYAKVVRADQITMAGFSAGDIVEIVTSAYGEDDEDFRVMSLTGGNYGYSRKTPEYIVRATDEEVAEAKDAAARAQFKKGAKVQLKSGGGEYPLLGFENGKVYSVTYNNARRTDGKSIEITHAGMHGYATPDQLELLTEEDVAEIEKWAAIGREVDEYKKGDVIQYLTDDREICEVVAVGEDGRVKVATQNHGNCTENQSSIELIAPVESRFDRKGVE